MPRAKALLLISVIWPSATLLANGPSPFVADLMVGLEQMFRESVLGETTSTVEQLTGKPPGTLSQWLAENIEVFRK